MTRSAGCGYGVKVMKNARAVSAGVRDWLAGSRDERLTDLHDAFADPEVRCVLSAIGGNHSAQLLEGLDLDLIRDHPKLVCGWSATTLLLSLYARTGLVTVYGPALLPEFGEIGGPDSEVVDQFERVTSLTAPAGAFPSVPWQAVENRQISDAEHRARRREKYEPRLVLCGVGTQADGSSLGCLPSIRTLIGTPWEPDWSGSMLVIETPESPYDPSVGRCRPHAPSERGHPREHRGSGGGPNRRLERGRAGTAARLRPRSLPRLRLPVIAGIELLHAAPLLALPIGVLARLVDDQLIIEEAAVT